jgi:cyclic-di-AMP phosphodiesterase PgpH
MWPFRRRVGQRRLEVRKNIPASRGETLQRFRAAGGLTGLLLALALLVGALALDVWPLDPLPWRIGQYVPTDVHARANFEFLLPDRLEDAERDAARVRPSVFELEAKRIERVLEELKKLPDQLKATTQPADVDPELARLLALAGPDAPEALAAWRAYGEPEARTELEKQVETLREGLAGTYVVASEQVDAQWQRGVTSVVLQTGQYRRPTRLGELIGVEQETEIRQEARRLALPFDEALRPGVEAYLVDLLTREPIYAFDAEDSEADARQAMAEVRADPPEDCFATHKIGQRLVRASGNRGEDASTGLSAAEWDLLRREHGAYLEQKWGKQPWSPARRIASRGLILGLLVFFLCIYVVQYRPRIARNRWRALAVTLMVLLMLAATKGLIVVLGLNVYSSILPVLLATVILCIAYDQRLALGLGALMSALAALQFRADLAMFVVLMASVATAVLQLDEIRTRSKLVRVLGVASVVVFATIFAFGLFRGVPIRFVLPDSVWGGVFTLLVGFLAQGILPVVERVFRIATNMTLLEWCDASKPLMRRVAMEGPGTHNHSLQLGSMCEAAAEAIGANGLLARVGAYYHDIGKINKPDYFVENQTGSASRHAKLSPAMSLLIIVGHVKDGIELAKEYGLPRVLHEFIETHHGTTLVQYFYHAAAEQRKNDKDRAPEEVEFRYPGPKPRSKEAGILMLADAAESSIRAMAEPTPGRIENQVHTMVSRRLMDAQLDDCDLTLRQVHQIETSLIKSLCGIYHSRLAYPTPPGEQPSASEMFPKTPIEGKEANGASEKQDQAPEPSPEDGEPSEKPQSHSAAP